MLFRIRLFAICAAILASVSIAFAQDSGFNLAMHADFKAGPAEIGLPSYPGATLDKDKGNDSSANLGLNFGDFHFTLLAVDYKTGDSAAQVFAFYRKSLSRYGEVLECDHGKPVGSLKITRSGLACSEQKGDHLQVNSSADSSKDHELRAGTPHKFRIVGINDAQQTPTRFSLVYIELPKDDGNQSK